ncbi:MAG: sulfurtransferase TusA family protein [Promethearchaeota archaeon]|jgi:TusA-related sulfurtransferase|nr:MAG: sulfurtransferase TusA family protein [Candidatus Lokiarchaeota archaeon]
MADVTLNALGKKCPMPILLTKKELNKMSSGQTLELIVDDKGALKDIPAMVNTTGNELVSTNESDAEIRFVIKKA